MPARKHLLQIDIFPLNVYAFVRLFLKKSDTALGCGDIPDDVILEEYPLSVGKCMELDGSDIVIAHGYVLFNLAITESFLK